MNPAAATQAVPRQEAPGGWLPRFDPARSAVLLDFDGTLVDLADRPEDVQVSDALRRALGRLSARLDGALAVVSGRAVEAVDGFLRLPQLTVAGVHGAELRRAHQRITRMPLPDLRAAEALLDSFERSQEGVHLERKPGALALHFRLAPHAEAVCLATMYRAQAMAPHTALQRGKMVIELKPAGASKGGIVRELLALQPFRGRRPWYFGDDLTDETAFEVVQSLEGVAVKIGAGETLAASRLAQPADLLRWMEQILND